MRKQEGGGECWSGFRNECPYRLLSETPGLDRLVAVALGGIRRDEHTDPKTKVKLIAYHPDRDAIRFTWDLHGISKPSRRRRSMDFFRMAAVAAEEGATGVFREDEADEEARAVIQQHKADWERMAERKIAEFEERKRRREARKAAAGGRRG